MLGRHLQKIELSLCQIILSSHFSFNNNQRILEETLITLYNFEELCKYTN